MRRNWQRLPPIRRSELVNEEIYFPEILVIDEKNKNLGLMTNKAALNLAAEKKLDLVCINKQNTPPICKILNYESYRFQKQKQEKKLHKIRKKIKIKEIQISASIGDNDLKIKLKRAQQFLKKKFKIKVTMRLKGREKYLQNYGLDKIEILLEALKEDMVLVKSPKLKNNVYNLLLEPKIQKGSENKNHENKNENPQIS